MKKTCICSIDVFSEKKRQASVFLEKKDNLLHWWARSLSHVYCLSNTMKAEFGRCKQRWDVWWLREIKIKYDTRAWLRWMAWLCFVQCLRMEVRVPSLAALPLVTLGLKGGHFSEQQAAILSYCIGGGWRREVSTWTTSTEMIFELSLVEVGAQADTWGGKRQGQRAECFGAPAKESGFRGSSEKQLRVGRGNGNRVLTHKPPSVCCTELRLEEWKYLCHYWGT